MVLVMNSMRYQLLTQLISTVLMYSYYFNLVCSSDDDPCEISTPEILTIH